MTAVEQTRLLLSKSTDAKKKSQLGQFFTPESIASFMAGLFPDSSGSCRLLDAGAGIGSLSSAFLKRWRNGELNFERVELDAYEIDPSLLPYLAETLSGFGQKDLNANCKCGDFIRTATEAISDTLFARSSEPYTHAILNPPYKKIKSSSEHRQMLRGIGIETVNLYSAFVALAVALSAQGGQIVAIIPRSFCNGPYYRPFREFILSRTAIRHIHLFDSRNQAFKDDEVLQENIIIRLERGGQQGAVKLTTSTDDSFDDLMGGEYPFERIVSSGDSERFIRIPTPTCESGIRTNPSISSSLQDLGLKVSTGPVVDFRAKEHLRDMPGRNTAPLIYPAHFNKGSILWPRSGIRKPNAIVHNADTEKSFYPKGFYCVVRRFSSKEENRRIVASVVEPTVFPDAPVLGFENHLNLFHDDKQGLPESIARGMAVYLNSTAVDEEFRTYSGHTQVNATDLKRMKYPDRETLAGLGRWAASHREPTQEMIDSEMERVTA